MLGFGIKTFCPQVVRGFRGAFLSDVLGVELLEALEGLPPDGRPD